MVYVQPNTVDEALAALADTAARPVAGGTDFYPALGDAPPPAHIVDLTRIPDLRGITRTGQGWRIGGATSWTDILRSDLPPAFDGLKLAAREVGSVQIQNAGTIAGNLCNASPAADGVPPLLTLDARVEVVGSGGARTLPLTDFITGVRQTALEAGEIVTAITIPAPAQGTTSSFLKLGSRKYLVISIVMLAVTATIEDGILTNLRISVGACSPVAQRLPALERALTGQPLTEFGPITPELLSDLAPIDDVRGSATYRLEAVAELCRRAILAAGAYG